jgi:hypothetical protein
LPIDQRRCEAVEFRRDEIGEEINFKTEKMKVNYSVAGNRMIAPPSAPSLEARAVRLPK